MKIQELFTKIQVNPENPRRIKDKKFIGLKKKIEFLPQGLETHKIVYDSSNDYIVLGGNRRYDAVAALLKEGKIELKAEYFADAASWSPEQKREFIVIDNISDGDWDWDKLGNQYEAPELVEWGLDLPKTFTGSNTEEDNAPGLSDEPAKSKLGEMYQLGRHRLLCGDATKLEDAKRLMDGKLADMVFTDPPYNVDYEGKTKEKLKIQNDKKGNDDFYTFLLESMQNMAGVTRPGGAIYVTHADSEGLNFRKSFIEAGYLLKQCIIWNKNVMVMGRQDYHWKHEPILYGWKDGGPHQWYGPRNQTTVWDIDRPSRSSEHPTMKPIELIGRALDNSSKEDDIVIDFFLGSGSTLIACEQLKRSCYGLELDPKYCDVIRKRYWMQVNDGKDDGWETGTPVI